MAVGGKSAAFISVEVDVVDIERSRNETGRCNTITDLVSRRGCSTISVVPAEVGKGVEFEVNLHFVVLESNEWQSKSRVAAEPELKRDVESVFRRAVANFSRSVGFTSTTVRITSFTTLDEEVDEFRNIAYHFSVTGLFTGFLGEFVPDVEPITIMFVTRLPYVSIRARLYLMRFNTRITSPLCAHNHLVVEPSPYPSITDLGAWLLIAHLS